MCPPWYWTPHRRSRRSAGARSTASSKLFAACLPGTTNTASLPFTAISRCYRSKREWLRNYAMTDSFADRNILVVGGAGFVGSNLVRKILEQKPRKLTIIDNFLDRKSTRLNS